MNSSLPGRAVPGLKRSDFDPDDDFSRRPESRKDLRGMKMGMSLTNVYNQQEEFVDSNLFYTVEKTVKKHADNLLKSLEGISGRLSQLEFHCYSFEQSIGELRSDLVGDNGEADMKLTSLKKHLQEVHTSIQILIDKQELADTNKELAKQKQSTTMMIPSPHNEPALAFPCQTTVPTSVPARAVEQQIHQPFKEPPPIHQSIPPSSLPTQQTVPFHTQNQPNMYYTTPQNQLPNQTLQPQQHLHALSHQRPQIQDVARQAQQQLQPHVNQSPTHPLPPAYHHQCWTQQSPQQLPQQAQREDQSLQPQNRSQTPTSYPTYLPQPGNPLPESLASSMQMQLPLSGVPLPEVNCPTRAAAYSYREPSRTVPQQPPQQHNIQHQPSDGIGGQPSAGPYSQQPTMHGYLGYSTDGSRPPNLQHFQQASYPPSHVSAVLNQPLPPSIPANHHLNLQMAPNHLYRELIEKAVSMGYARDQVANAIRWMEESGQPILFNSLLDRLKTRF